MGLFCWMFNSHGSHLAPSSPLISMVNPRWFQLFFMFTPIWGRLSCWLIYFYRSWNHLSLIFGVLIGDQSGESGVIFTLRAGIKSSCRYHVSWDQADDRITRVFLRHWTKKKLDGGNSNIFWMFTPILGVSWSNLTIIFFKWVGSTTN